jgi:hypothetical protein
VFLAAKQKCSCTSKQSRLEENHLTVMVQSFARVSRNRLLWHMNLASVSMPTECSPEDSAIWSTRQIPDRARPGLVEVELLP